MIKLFKGATDSMPPNCAKCNDVCWAAYSVSDDAGAKIKVCGKCWLSMPSSGPRRRKQRPPKPSVRIQL